MALRQEPRKPAKDLFCKVSYGRSAIFMCTSASCLVARGGQLSQARKIQMVLAPAASSRLIWLWVQYPVDGTWEIETSTHWGSGHRCYLDVLVDLVYELQGTVKSGSIDSSWSLW